MRQIDVECIRIFFWINAAIVQKIYANLIHKFIPFIWFALFLSHFKSNYDITIFSVLHFLHTKFVLYLKRLTNLKSGTRTESVKKQPSKKIWSDRWLSFNPMHRTISLRQICLGSRLIWKPTISKSTNKFIWIIVILRTQLCNAQTKYKCN